MWQKDTVVALKSTMMNTAVDNKITRSDRVRRPLFLKGTFYGVLFIWGRVKKFFNKAKYFRFFCVYISERAEKAYPAASVTPVSRRQGRSSHKCETLSLF